MSYIENITIANSLPSGANTIGGVQPVGGQGGGANSFNLLAPATPAASNVQNTPCKIWSIQAENFDANVSFLHLFDTNTAPNVGNTAATATLAIPASTTGAGFIINYPVGRKFSNGLFLAVSANVGSTDKTSVTANTTIIDITYSS